MKRYPKRKLLKADGERILWHALEHLQTIAEWSASFEIYILLRNYFGILGKKVVKADGAK